MRDTIGLFYNKQERNGHMTGCQKLLNNLLIGLERIGVKVQHNVGKEMCGTLSGGTRQFVTNSLPEHCLIGPEICVLPSEMEWAFMKHKNWVQPSEWVVEYMKQFERLVRGVNFHVWSGGIDTDEFQPKEVRAKAYDCFIYYKDVTKQVSKVELGQLRKYLDIKQLKYKVLSYGSYTEKEYIDTINTSKFGVWLVGTESQNIAIGEAQAMNCPIYVLDVKQFIYYRFSFKSDKISSAPYFDERCGIKHIDLSRLDEFISKLDSYNPRQYIMDNHTLEKAAQNYVDILKKVQEGTNGL